ncbi:MAG: phospholipid carrier-dependent glycosyltransferase [Flavobacteriaceae bacterium]|nr:phospholipid carrier-dependent glycosyltransferase [Flavobacteriaceae bacterium]
MISVLEKNPLTSLLLVVSVMLFIHLDIPNITIMEARNFITMREMLQDNHWLLTTMNGQPRYEKPPLPTWITSIAGILFGAKNIWALRLPAVMMVYISGVFTYLISIKLNLSKQYSFINALIAITSFYVFAIINEAPWDIYAHAFTLITIYYLIGIFQSKTPLIKKGILAGFFMACSILSKGPVSIVALLIPFLISYGIVFKFGPLRKNWIPLLYTFFIALTLGLSWYVYIKMVDPLNFTAISKEEVNNWTQYNTRPLYYYWSFFIQSGIWTIPALISLCFPYILKKTRHKKIYTFTFLWTMTAVIILSCIPEKKARYLMPVLIPLALNTGIYIQYLMRSFNSMEAFWEKLVVYIGFGSIALIGLISPLFLYYILSTSSDANWTAGILLAITLFGSSILIIYYLKKKEIHGVFYTVVFFMVSLLFFGLPITRSIPKNPAFNSISKLHTLEESHAIKSYTYKTISPELIWGYGDIIKELGSAQFLSKETSYGLLVQQNELAHFKASLPKHLKVDKKAIYNHNIFTKQNTRLIVHYFIISK